MSDFVKDKSDLPDLPAPVSLRDAADAIEALRVRGRVDIDAYLARVSVTEIMKGPVGPTPDCLTLDQLDQYAWKALATEELPHLTTCEHCTEALKAYRMVKERPLDETSTHTLKMSVAVTGKIALAPDLVHFDVVLHTGQAFAMSPAQLKIDNGIFQNAMCQRIDEVESDPQGGYFYRAVCVATPKTTVFKSWEPRTEFVDWVKVIGVTDSGKAFSAADLVRFTVPQHVLTLDR